MVTFENRPNTALLVVDVQNGVVAGAHQRDDVVASVGSLVDKARLKGSPLSGCRGYAATLVADAHTTEDQTAWGAQPPAQVIARTNLYRKFQTAPGRTAGTVETRDFDFHTY
jgi:hypothetical protein